MTKPAGLNAAPLYCASWYFDFGSGTCLWSANDRARDEFDYLIDPDDLPVPAPIRTMLNDLCAVYDTALNWASPSEPGPWTAADWSAFGTQAKAALETLRRELGPEWEITDDSAL
jgi:hypothetical protein